MVSGIQLVLVGLAIFGFLPLSIILYKRNRAKRILTTGTRVNATIFDIYSLTRPRHDIVHYSFYPVNSTKACTGRLSTETGKYRIGDILDIYYLPHKPHLNTMKGAWDSKMIIVFGVIIALFVLFAAYKLNEMVETGQMQR